jgi:hypothetical protein
MKYTANSNTVLPVQSNDTQPLYCYDSSSKTFLIQKPVKQLRALQWLATSVPGCTAQITKMSSVSIIRQVMMTFLIQCASMKG